MAAYERFETKELTPASVAEVNRLLKEVKPEAETLTETDVRLIAVESYLAVARRAGMIVGMATLTDRLLPTGRKAFVDDVAVDPGFRGQGVGEGLVLHVIGEARRRDCIAVELTSRSARVAANRLYEKLGFVKKDTNFFQLKLAPQEYGPVE
jgi:ribosomal protein S18 acetylase RimI-like enzyme